MGCPEIDPVPSIQSLLLVFLLGPPSTMPEAPDRTPPSSPAIVAHRGASEDAPENTLAAFRLGFEQGADAIEGDFRLTSDGVVVAMHDETLARTSTDPRKVSEISHRTLSTLSVGDWGRWRGLGFEAERAPTLAEVLEVVPDGRGILIELKDGPQIVPAVLAVLEASSIPSDRVTIIAFDADVVETFKRMAPERRALWLTSFRRRGGDWSPAASDVVATARRIHADGVDVKADARVIDEGFVEIIRAADLELHVWTVNDPELARRMVRLGVDSITTDRPRDLRARVRRVSEGVVGDR